MTESIGNRPLNWAERRAIVLDRAGYECASCGATATEADHKWPRVAGGTDDFENLQALCRHCNASKGDSLEYQHMTPERLLTLAAIRLNGAAEKATGAARFIALAMLISEGQDAATAAKSLSPGAHSIPMKWRRWVDDSLADKLDIPLIGPIGQARRIDAEVPALNGAPS